jgi:hypothetical protein
LAIAASGGTIGISPTVDILAEGDWMEDDGYIDLQMHYGGQYVVLRGREVLAELAKLRRDRGLVRAQPPSP